VAFDEKFERALSYNDKLFSDAFPLRRLQNPHPTTDTVIDQTGDATTTSHLLEEGTGMISDPQSKTKKHILRQTHVINMIH
jgi:hypothetical protein